MRWRRCAGTPTSTATRAASGSEVELLEEHDREIGRRTEELPDRREHVRGKIRY
jgi:hypothetical protein